MPTIHLIGSASSIAANEPGSGGGPVALQESALFSAFCKAHDNCQWQGTVKPNLFLSSKTQMVHDVCDQVASYTIKSVQQKEKFIVIGGDHSCAIGTWSGVHHGLGGDKPIGLIWIDAHLDSHTPETSESGNIHGMPLATLLGHGESSLKSIFSSQPKLLPENVCIIGARSFEKGEKELLESLNVRIFYMDEVKKRGIVDVFNEALQIVQSGTEGFGISLDLDALDPSDAPGVSVPEENGINCDSLCEALKIIQNDESFLGAEIVEFNPERDKDNKTIQSIVSLLEAFIGKG